MRPIHILAALLLALALGCFRTHGDRPDDHTDLGPADRDLGRPSRDSGTPSLDAFVDCPPDLGPPIPEIRITAEEADCVGLTHSDCASCHQRDDGWVLRPMGAPSPPIGPTDPIDISLCIPDCRFD